MEWLVFALVVGGVGIAVILFAQASNAFASAARAARPQRPPIVPPDAPTEAPAPSTPYRTIEEPVVSGKKGPAASTGEILASKKLCPACGSMGSVIWRVCHEGNRVTGCHRDSDHLHGLCSGPFGCGLSFLHPITLTRAS